jgi:hypothetical protein
MPLVLFALVVLEIVSYFFFAQVNLYHDPPI